MNILEALDDPHLLGSAIRDHASYRPWRAFMAALFGLPLDDYGEELFRRCTGRSELPSAPYEACYLICGRRAGKSFQLALTACFVGLFKEWTKYLSPGERAVVLLVAADREQAKIIRRYVGGILEAPMLAPYVVSETQDAVELRGNVVIEVATCSFRSTRGRSVCCAILDESAFMRQEGSASPDTEVYNAVRAGMAQFGSDGLVIIASSPYAKRGLLWDGYRRYFGKDDPKTLVWVASTRWMNPSIPASFVAAEYERDSASASAEYGNDDTPVAFRADISAFVSRDVVDNCVVPNRHELPPISGIRYLAFTDPSGGSSDSFTLAIAHHDKASGRAIIDAIRARKPPFSPDGVVQDFAALLKTYGVHKVTGDRYAGEWPRERFRVHGIQYELAEKPKSDIYRDMLPLLNSGRVELLGHAQLISQLCGLERRTSRGGRDSIDHPPGAFDDIANAVGGAILLAVGGPKPIVITDELLALSRVPGLPSYSHSFTKPRAFFGGGSS